MADASGLECQVLRPSDPLDEWDRFVDESPQGCVFCRSWWLEALWRGPWEILTLRKNGRIVAGIPLPRGRRGIWSTITVPPLTQTLGVLLAPEADDAKYVSLLSGQMAVLRTLVEALPRVDFFRTLLHPSLTNWLPFAWAGYEQTTRYTYVIEDLSDLEAVREGLAPQLRTKLRKAEKSGIRIEEGDDLETFLVLNAKTFAHLGTPRPYSDDDVRRLDAACRQHEARRMLFARDETGRVHAVLSVVLDGRCAYNLIGGTDPELRGSAANHLLLWRALELAHDLKRSFDFCGSMLEGVESFNRSFGAVQKPVFEIRRYGSVTARAASGLHGLLATARRPRRARPEPRGEA